MPLFPLRTTRRKGDPQTGSIAEQGGRGGMTCGGTFCLQSLGRATKHACVIPHFSFTLRGVNLVVSGTRLQVGMNFARHPSSDGYT